MLSFHNDQKIKDKYIDRIIYHQKMDNIIQGIGWDNEKGCAVGCTLENYDHSRYPIELGLPEWLARLEDYIFENLPTNEAKEWPLKFLQSIKVGVNVEDIKHKISILRMNRLIEIQERLFNNIENKDIILTVINAINLVKKCHEAELNKSSCDWSAAWSAAESAWSAAWSAAESAAESAWSAAESARSAAESARSAVWKQESNNLLKLLSE